MKFFFKEDIIPTHADRLLYILAPAIALFSALTTFAVIPYGATFRSPGGTIPLIGADVSIGLLYVFAMTSLSVYGIVLAGWSSNNKFSLMGGASLERADHLLRARDDDRRGGRDPRRRLVSD